MIKMLVDLAARTILDKKPPEDTHAPHPHNLTVVPLISLLKPLTTILSRPLHRGAEADISSGVTYVENLASFVPFLLPYPLCRPIRRAADSSRARARECMVTGFLMIRPSAIILRIDWRELAFEISDTSFGSNHILRLPQPATEAARRF